MTKRLAVILALTCASAWGEDVIIQGTSVSNIHGSVKSVSSISTNLSVTGTPNPDVTGTNYVQITDESGCRRWYNYDHGFYIRCKTPENVYWITPSASGRGTNIYPVWEHIGYGVDPVGVYTTYLDSIGLSGNSTGTPVVASWCQTNYSSVVIVHGR